MAIKKALAGVATAVGIGVLSLTASFNNAAFAEPTPAPSPEAVVPATGQNVLPATPETIQPAAQPANIQHSQALLAAIKGIDDYFFSENHPRANNPEYDSAADPFLQNSVTQILDSLKAGADPNYVDPQTGASAFAWGLWLAYELDRPDIVAEFLKHGADPSQKMPANMPIPQSEQNALQIIFGKDHQNKPGEIAIIDHAIRALMESQAMNMFAAGTMTHSRTAAQIAVMIHKANGQTPADALQLPDDADIKTFSDLVKNVVTAASLKEVGLLTPEEYDFVAYGDPALADIARNISAITPEFLEQHNAPLVFYPDTIPGGPEPYNLEQGDTPQSIARRFQSVMGAADEAEALRLLTERNKDIIAADGNFVADSVGKEIMIPVTENIQVGQIPAPSPIQALAGLIIRMKMYIGAQSFREAVKIVTEANNIDLADENFKLDDVISIGATIKIPTLLGGTITTTVLPEDALNNIARNLRGRFYDKQATPERILSELQRMNDIDPSNLVLKSCDATAKDNLAEKCDTLWVPFYNDGYEHLQPLTPPASHDTDRKVHLFIVENESEHQKQASSAATNTAYAVNRNVDFSLFHVLKDAIWGTYVDYMDREASKILRILQHPENPLRDQIVFSSSLASALHAVGDGSQSKGEVPVSVAEHRRHAREGDHAGFENSRLLLDRLEQASPIVFQAVGNSFPASGAYSDRYSTLHSGRTVRVGAYGTYNGNRMIAPYSTVAADICGPLPKNLGRQMEGTSFSDPATAALYRQFSEWYGDVLSFEEIMAAGMMTADRDIPDLFALPLNPPRPTPAQYRTNGAGLPHHVRCGAGALNAERWNEALKEMVALKHQNNPAGAFRSFKIDINDEPAERTLANGEKEYVYRIVVPEDMTLGKLTFLVPQEQFAHSEIVVKAPSGFELRLQRSLNEIISTSAFNYEDVKAGDVIEIRTGEKLAANAGMYLRGHENDNVIQMLRDQLSQRGVLPAPLKTMAGETITGDDPGINIDLTPDLPPLPKREPPPAAKTEDGPEQTPPRTSPHTPPQNGPAPN